MPLLKRPAAAAVASEPKPKQQKQQTQQKQEQVDDPITSKCSTISSALMEAEGISEVTRRMLASSLRHCVATPKNERHKVQSSVIDMISEVLSGIEAGHEEKVAAMNAKIADADAEKGRREAALLAASEAVAERTEAVKTAETRLQDAKEANTAAWSEVGAATAAQKEGDADLMKAEGRKSTAEATMSNVFIPLKDGCVDNLDESIKRLSNVATDLGLEEQLIATAAVVLRKPAGERATFDSVVVQQIDEQLATAIAKLTAQLANGEAGKLERATKVQACQSKAKDAQMHVEACSEVLKVAQAALKDAEVARQGADAAIHSMGPEMEEAAANAAAAGAELVACKADLSTFEELVQGEPVVPEPVPAEGGDEIQPDASTEQV